jgi:hypothetical protein
MPIRGEVLTGEERNLKDELIKSGVPKKQAMAFCLKSIKELQKDKTTTKVAQLVPLAKREDMFIEMYPFNRIDPASYQSEADQSKLQKKQLFAVLIFDILGLAAGLPEKMLEVSSIMPAMG